MATEQEFRKHDLNAQLADAIRLLAERVTPKALDEDAQKAIRSHAAIARRLRTVFLGEPDAPATSHHKY